MNGRMLCTVNAVLEAKLVWEGFHGTMYHEMVPTPVEAKCPQPHGRSVNFSCHWLHHSSTTFLNCLAGLKGIIIVGLWLKRTGSFVGHWHISVLSMKVLCAVVALPPWPSSTLQPEAVHCHLQYLLSFTHTFGIYNYGHFYLAFPCAHHPYQRTPSDSPILYASIPTPSFPVCSCLLHSHCASLLFPPLIDLTYGLIQCLIIPLWDVFSVQLVYRARAMLFQHQR